MQGWIFDPRIAKAIAFYIKCPFMRLALSWTCRRGYTLYHDQRIVDMWYILSAQKIERMNFETGLPREESIDTGASIIMAVQSYFQKVNPKFLISGVISSKYDGNYIIYEIESSTCYATGMVCTNSLTSFVCHQWNCCEKNTSHVNDMFWYRITWSVDDYNPPRKVMILVGRNRM